MNKRQHVKPTRLRRRIFPNDYTRDDLIEYLVSFGVENYRQAEQIEALMHRVRQLERLRR